MSSGLVAGLATFPLAPVQGWAPSTAWVLVFGGTALLPDLDSASATASRTWGSLTGALRTVVALVSRGHRQGTHDAVLAPVAAAAVVALASAHPLASGVVLALIIGLTLRGLSLTGAGALGVLVNLALSAGGAWWLISNGAAHTAGLPLVVAGGVLVHIAGDFLTEGGVPVPVAWLFGVDRRLALGLFRTGHTVERMIVAPALTCVGLWLVIQCVPIFDVLDWSNSLITTS